MGVGCSPARGEGARRPPAIKALTASRRWLSTAGQDQPESRAGVRNMGLLGTLGGYRWALGSEMAAPRRGGRPAATSNKSLHRQSALALDDKYKKEPCSAHRGVRYKISTNDVYHTQPSVMYIQQNVSGVYVTLRVFHCVIEK